tara:strand:+ start:828 stop:1100 length:273 start_codon:yes stop_codon:yes gene_type:complete
MFAVATPIARCLIDYEVKVPGAINPGSDDAYERLSIDQPAIIDSMGSMIKQLRCIGDAQSSEPLPHPVIMNHAEMKYTSTIMTSVVEAPT